MQQKMVESIYDLHEQKNYTQSNNLIDQLIETHVVENRTWLMINILKSFNLKELKEWQASRNTLVKTIKKLSLDQGVEHSDAKLYEEFDKIKTFGQDVIKKALELQDSKEDASQILVFYSKICEDVRNSLNSSEQDPEFLRLGKLWKERPEDLQHCYDLANRAAQLQKYELALELLLSIISKDKNWKEGSAVNRMKSLFDEIGPGKPYVLKTRKEMSFWLH